MPETSHHHSFSVVICAYTDRRWNDLIDAVRSVHHQTHPAHELIVVIDHNPELLQRAKATFQDTTVIENRFEQGLSGARNTGVESATGDIVAFLDDDAVAEPNWLERMNAAFADEKVMGVGTRIDLQWQGNAPTWFPAEFNWTVGGTYRGMPEQAAPIRNMIGASMAIRREYFQQGERFRSGVGRTDTVKLPLGCEETELCIRLSQAHPGRYFLYEPGTRVHHRVPQSRASWRYFAQRCYAEGLSKAHVSRLVGRGDGLSTERGYVLRTLPSGVLRGLRDGLLHRDKAGFGRAAAITGGLFVTGAGYLVGSLPSLRLRQPGSTSTHPASS